MKIPVFIQKFFNKITKARFFYVTLDVCPDWTTCQSEMCSYTVRANDEETARGQAIKKAMKDWGVDDDSIYVVDCEETISEDLIYDR